jgi:hypothetical protein
LGALAMPITPFLNGIKFDAETTRIMGVALEMVCIALRTGECDDDVRQSIANKIIDLARAGERNPDVLCERALRDIRGGTAASVGGLVIDRYLSDTQRRGTGLNCCARASSNARSIK